MAIYPPAVFFVATSLATLALGLITQGLSDCFTGGEGGAASHNQENDSYATDLFRVNPFMLWTGLFWPIIRQQRFGPLLRT